MADESKIIEACSFIITTTTTTKTVVLSHQTQPGERERARVEERGREPARRARSGWDGEEESLVEFLKQ